MTADDNPSEDRNPSADAGTPTAKPGLISGAVPVSTFMGPVASLAETGLIGPPTRPGLVGILDRFELVRVLGSGGMGSVFLARDTETGRTVAVKMLRPEFVSEPRVVERFIIEARHLQKLKHPSLVPVLETRELNRGAFFVMPYFEQGSLAQMIQPGIPLGPETILPFAQSIAEALRFTHSKGIIHRDIKPGNILIGEDGSAFLGDFGLARSLFNDAVIDVEREQCEGTAPYMSPAVAAGEAEDTRCDIYGLGAVLYEMLTGRPPFQGQTTRAIRDQIMAGQPRPILELNPSADPRLVQIAGWAMEREHRNRYSSMADLATDLQLVATGNPPLGPHSLGRTNWFPMVSLRPRVAWAIFLTTLSAGLAIAAWLFWPRLRLEVIHTLNPPQVTSWARIGFGILSAGSGSLG
jgi:serine/threonine protein kinase